MSATRMLRKALVRSGSDGVVSVTVGLVVCGHTADIQDQPCVGYLHDHGVSLKDHLAAEHRLVELARPLLIGHDQKVGDDKAILARSRKVGLIRAKYLLLR